MDPHDQGIRNRKGSDIAQCLETKILTPHVMLLVSKRGVKFGSFLGPFLVDTTVTYY